MAPKKKQFIGDILQKKGISAETIQEALLGQKKSGMRLGEFLLSKGIVSEELLQGSLSELFNMPFEKKLEFSDPDNVLSTVPHPFLIKNLIVPYSVKKKSIYIAVNDPLNLQSLDELKLLLRSYKCIPIISTKDEILRLIHTHFALSSTETTDDVIENLEESEVEILSGTLDETEDIMDMANEAPIIRLVNTIVRQAVNDKASDIHFEPYENDFIVRFRIDGILYKMFTPPKKYQGAIISRIKIMANLNIAENRLPQDGRIQVKIGGKDIDIRVSVFPIYNGERIVLRLLNKSDMDYNLEKLGFNETILGQFKREIAKTSGIILVTGPTGSGKSTTLYSSLVLLNEPDINILTVEDPIEYRITGIGQMQVKPKIELTFANGLRSILRQDPDIIMVGEIRDGETAEIAIQSSLTGHKVFSTLHTNDAATGFTRLMDMGVEPYLISSSVNAILAQRLVRKICNHCKEKMKITPAIRSEIAHLGLTAKKTTLYKGKGCSQCMNTGYSGRIGIYELLPLTTEIKKLIMTETDATSIKDLAIKGGMRTLQQDGMDKAFAGETTIEEVLRVTQ